MNMNNVNFKYTLRQVLLVLKIIGYVRTLFWLGWECGWSLYTVPFQNRFDPLVSTYNFKLIIWAEC